VSLTTCTTDNLAFPAGFTFISTQVAMGPSLTAIDAYHPAWFASNSRTLTVSAYPSFLRGDANHDGSVSLADTLYILEYLFEGGPILPCLASGDVENNDSVTISDSLYILAYLFEGGPAPASPFPTCTSDTEFPDLGCVADCP
jgi:hypothetical protein